MGGPVAFVELMDYVGKAFEAVGVLVLVLGLVWSVVVSGLVWRKAEGREAYRVLRESFGGVLLLGLEILVAADLIRTVAVEPSMENVLVLGLIVLIRTFLSFSLEIEIEGVPPWRRATTSGAGLIGRATTHAREAGTGGQP
jgi:uncharacterized membrane protein